MKMHTLKKKKIFYEIYIFQNVFYPKTAWKFEVDIF